ncbi:lipopolysaccharide biosynthesis protein [Chroococcidiopsis cubana CCALA 043]|nr:lipopolysaccharide biosynthesis protein [Chroococcidiopsis cubana CCALA 043]
MSAATDPKQYFCTDHLKVDLRGRSVRGGAITVVTQICKFLLNIGAIIFLARLLTPEDFGLVAMVATVTNFVTTFKDLGLSMATIQRAEINHGQVSTLFWVNAVLGIVMMVLLAALSPVIAKFYGEPRLTGITFVLASALAFSGLMVQHEALLRRQMRFTALGAIQIASILAGIATAIVSIWYGAGYWALVFKQVAEQVTSTIGVWLMCGWRPGPPLRYSGVRSMLAFGRDLTGFSLINYFARNLDTVLIGWRWGAQQLGMYDKAYQLLLLPIQQINTPLAAVATPALSRLVDAPERYRHAYLRILEKVAMLAMPQVVFMIATSDWLVWLLLGSQWSDASRIFAWLGFSALVQPVSNTTGWLFMTQGRTWEMFQWGVIGGGIAIVSIIAGLPWGAVGVAASYSIIGLVIRTPLLFWFVGRNGPVQARDFYRAIAPSAYASFCALLVLLAFRQWLEVSQPIIGLLIAFAITVVITLLVLTILPAGRLALIDFSSLFTLLVKSRRKKLV